MIRFFFVVLFVLGIASASMAQDNNVSNSIPQATSGSVMQTNNALSNVPTIPAPPPIPQVSAPEKPAVIITAQGTVLTDEQKQLVSQKLQEIPGVIVITNRIHVVGQINEAAGAATTNRGKAPRSGNYRTPRQAPK